MTAENVVAFDPARRRRPGRGRRPARPAGAPLLGLLPSWIYRLEEDDKSPRTIRSYGDSVRKLARWLEVNGHPVDAEGVQAEHIRAYLAAERDRTSAATAAVDYRNLRVFWAWVTNPHVAERTGPNPMDDVTKPPVKKKAKTFFTDQQQAVGRGVGGTRGARRTTESSPRAPVYVAGPSPRCSAARSASHAWKSASASAAASGSPFPPLAIVGMLSSHRSSARPITTRRAAARCSGSITGPRGGRGGAIHP